MIEGFNLEEFQVHKHSYKVFLKNLPRWFKVLKFILTVVVVLSAVGYLITSILYKVLELNYWTVYVHNKSWWLLKIVFPVWVLIKVYLLYKKVGNDERVIYINERTVILVLPWLWIFGKSYYCSDIESIKDKGNRIELRGSFISNRKEDKVKESIVVLKEFEDIKGLIYNLEIIKG